ncbi:MAG: hypothetical protein H6635_06865 [Anaerolineales bacterium]|nr:hypothetical protein [Anaerolineales bacterium]MCB9145074.1 hypothetical protein [Anaerolineales bacterium]
MSLEASSRTYRFILADVLTAGYRMAGKVSVTTHGAMGFLNDPTKSILDIHDARMARLHMPTKLVDHFELVRSLKSHVHAVCLSRREDLGPQAIVRGGYSNVVEYQIRLSTPVFEVEGIMELPGRFDFAGMVTEGTREFLPMFNATLTAILIPTLRVQSAGILVNRRMIDMIALLNQRVKPEN